MKTPRLSAVSLFCLLFVVVFWGSHVTRAAEVPAANYDETKIPDFTLPNVLHMEDGSPVVTAEDWNIRRRPELLAMFEKELYGAAPTREESRKRAECRVVVRETDSAALNGTATRKQLRLHFATATPVDVLIYIPNHVEGKVPFFISYNFPGNHTVNTDPGIFLANVWQREKDRSVIRQVAAETTRGSAASRWCVEKLMAAGYGLVTIYYGDVVPDFPELLNQDTGVRALFADNPHYTWGAIATWAWGLSRVMDVMETDSRLDTTKSIVIGHSRLGKTSLWAGATDPRFALVISNNSGCGGAAVSRREFGETLWRMNTAFPHWLCENAKKYNEKIDACPVDQHELIALIAPRPVYIASAVEDRWADPKGEFLAGFYASPVYKLLGTDGFGPILSAGDMPEVDTPVGGHIRYHIRTGKHDINEYDWTQYLRFADDFFTAR